MFLRVLVDGREGPGGGQEPGGGAGGQVTWRAAAGEVAQVAVHPVDHPAAFLAKSTRRSDSARSTAVQSSALTCCKWARRPGD